MMKYDINIYFSIVDIIFFCIFISFQVFVGFLKKNWLLIKCNFCLMQEIKCFRVIVNKKNEEYIFMRDIIN